MFDWMDGLYLLRLYLIRLPCLNFKLIQTSYQDKLESWQQMHWMRKKYLEYVVAIIKSELVELFIFISTNNYTLWYKIWHKNFGDKYRRKDTENDRAIFPELLFVITLPLIKISFSAFPCLPQSYWGRSLDSICDPREERWD